MLNECVNGLMSRDDVATVIKRVKIGTVPSGTGNALAAEVGGVHPIRAALAIIKGEQYKHRHSITLTIIQAKVDLWI
mgnify:CR=1 FL=1